MFEDNLMIYIIAGCVTGITLIIIIVIVISVRISRTKSTKKKPRQEFIREIRDGLQPVRLAALCYFIELAKVVVIEKFEWKLCFKLLKNDDFCLGFHDSTHGEFAIRTFSRLVL